MVNIKTAKKQPKWYFDLNPSGAVPCLQLDDGRTIPDSVIVCEFLDNFYPEKRLTPSDPYVNAQHKLLLEHYSTKILPANMKVSHGKDDGTGAALLTEAFEHLEKKLNGKFFGGYLVKKKFKFFA